ncbi:MAG: MBL fold metallo-hydrolase [Dehalococcoidia bacterium]|nr:MBL fold metallo-hydrolase [Dehalococcoidia bacterium]
MEITWLGHSCFRIKGKEATLITDPCSPETGYNINSPQADIVTVSHDHRGHNYIAPIEPVPVPPLRGIAPDAIIYARPKLIHGPGEYEIANVLITGIPAFHDSEEGGQRGKNCVYSIEIDGMTLCHLGDIGHSLSSGLVDSLSGLDVLFLPVGGNSTINAVTAVEILRALEPKIIIPMHYLTEKSAVNLEPLDRFLSHMALKDVVPVNRLSVTRSNLTDQNRVVVMDYPR